MTEIELSDIQGLLDVNQAHMDARLEDLKEHVDGRFNELSGWRRGVNERLTSLEEFRTKSTLVGQLLKWFAGLFTAIGIGGAVTYIGTRFGGS